MGGNALVYRVSRADEVHRALKEPKGHRQDDEPYIRFRREVQILRGLQGRGGIVSLVDSSLPDRPTRQARGYYVMPLMQPAREAARELAPHAVISGVGSVARTLSALSAQGIAHRDIKPENIYVHEGEWVVGDFGLVKVPEDLAVTREGRKLGPAWYLAPEMLRYSGELDASAADVYSLCKTLWVLLTGYGYPLPGPRLAAPRDVAQLYSLESYVALPGATARHLDSLLARGTDMRPEQRPSMTALADELELILRTQGERTVGVPPIGDLAARLAAATRRLRDEHQLRSDRVARHRGTAERIKAKLEPVRDGLRRALGPAFAVNVWLHPKVQVVGNERRDDYGPLIDEERYPYALVAEVSTSPTPLAWPGLTSGFCVGMDREGALYLYAFHILMIHPEESPDLQPTILWGEGAGVACGSAMETKETERLIVIMKEHLPEALERLLAALNG